MQASSQNHLYKRASPSSCRAPCPALNALANHGYLYGQEPEISLPPCRSIYNAHRDCDGRSITAWALVRAMNEVYHVSVPFGIISSLVATSVCGSGWSLNLDDLAAHNKIEHDASIVYDNARLTDKYALVTPNPELLEQFLTITDKDYLTIDDFIACRARRNATLALPLSSVHRFLAGGEMALTLQVFEDREERMSKEHLRACFGEERPPEGWELSKYKAVGIISTSRLNKKIQEAVAEIEKSK